MASLRGGISLSDAIASPLIRNHKSDRSHSSDAVENVWMAGEVVFAIAARRLLLFSQKNLQTKQILIATFWQELRISTVRI